MTIDIKPFMKVGLPKYRAICDALETAISKGLLAPGTQLPTHRVLAEQLGVSVQTVSNAYAYAEKKGVVNAWVGSGTYVSEYQVDRETQFMLIEDRDTQGRAIDLSIAHPVCTLQHKQLFNDTLIQIAQSDTDPLIRATRPVQGQKHHVAAVSKWLASQKFSVDPDRIVLCNGASHGLMIALGCIIQPGDLVACEDLVDHGLIARSRILNFKLCPLETDREGILVEAFTAACEQNAIKALCCTPSISNPASTHMSINRRIAIAEVAKKHNVMIIEDDVYGALEPDRAPPLSSLLDEQAFYITSLTKTVAPGLRVGFLVVPKKLLQHSISRLAASCWMATPILFEMAEIWINNGTLQRLIKFEQQEFTARQRLAKKILTGFEYDSHPNGMHIWLRLPANWSADELVVSAQQANILITGDQPFQIDQTKRLNRVRISLGMESSRYRFQYALKLLADMLSNEPPPSHLL